MVELIAHENPLIFQSLLSRFRIRKIKFEPKTPFSWKNAIKGLICGSLAAINEKRRERSNFENILRSGLSFAAGPEVEILGEICEMGLSGIWNYQLKHCIGRKANGEPLSGKELEAAIESAVDRVWDGFPP